MPICLCFPLSLPFSFSQKQSYYWLIVKFQSNSNLVFRCHSKIWLFAQPNTRLFDNYQICPVFRFWLTNFFIRNYLNRMQDTSFIRVSQYDPKTDQACYSDSARFNFSISPALYSDYNETRFGPDSKLDSVQLLSMAKHSDDGYYFCQKEMNLYDNTVTE